LQDDGWAPIRFEARSRYFYGDTDRSVLLKSDVAKVNVFTALSSYCHRAASIVLTDTSEAQESLWFPHRGI